MGTVKLSGLNDYLNPSPECVLPLTKPKKSFEVTLKTDINKKNIDKQPVKVTLSDCLSCSGCLTSSLPMLENDYYIQIFDTLIKSKCPVVSISTQSLLSLSAKYNLKLTETFIRLKNFFVSKGVKYVFNQNISEAIQLQEAKKEFDRSYKSNSTLICSNCPGWVIYAEKSLDGEFLGNMSRLMPLQAIQGLLVKFVVMIRHKVELNTIKYRKIFNPLLNLINVDEIKPNDIYHLCVTPCHDKKLELLRPDMVADYTNLCKLLQVEPDTKTLLIDGVITTSELDNLIKDDFNNINVKDEMKCNSDILTYEDIISIKSLLGIVHYNTKIIPNIDTISPYNHTEFVHSGGYAQEMLKYVSKKYGEQINHPEFKNISNKDYKQTLLVQDCGDKSNEIPPIKITVATGFRNIANVVSNIKAHHGFNYIELMACPGGCINGGGQIKNVAVDIFLDDRKYISSDQIPAIIDLETWLWTEISKLVNRNSQLLTMELRPIKETRIDW